MQNKFLATWIIAIFLFGVMTVFSLLPNQSVGDDGNEGLSSTEYVIHSNDMSSSGVEG